MIKTDQRVSSASRRRPNVPSLIAAAIDGDHVSGLTHNFYRYPARFSPRLARAVIEEFTQPGDVVFDPFMGGGTTLVEAMALGRRAVGTDISSLATFVSTTKTTVYTARELKRLRLWLVVARDAINMHSSAPRHATHPHSGYQRHLDRDATWRLRKCIEQAVAGATLLGADRLECFARCVVLRTAQWALDGRKHFPDVDGFRNMLMTFGEEMLDGARNFAAAVTETPGVASANCLNRSAAGIESDATISSSGAPRLVLTSPPYPGIHVLYHRWQIQGGKETPAPFWVANRLDGSGSSYYTMGGRTAQNLTSYFDQLRAALESVARVSDETTTIVQVVAFSDPSWQLPRYLSVADDAGLCEFRLRGLSGARDGRLWRTVPNRKWYADQRGSTNGSQEVVLFHHRRA